MCICLSEFEIAFEFAFAFAIAFEFELCHLGALHLELAKQRVAFLTCCRQAKKKKQCRVALVVGNTRRCCCCCCLQPVAAAFVLSLQLSWPSVFCNYDNLHGKKNKNLRLGASTRSPILGWHKDHGQGQLPTSLLLLFFLNQYKSKSYKKAEQAINKTCIIQWNVSRCHQAGRQAVGRQAQTGIGFGYGWMA